VTRGLLNCPETSNVTVLACTVPTGSTTNQIANRYFKCTIAPPKRPLARDHYQAPKAGTQLPHMLQPSQQLELLIRWNCSFFHDQRIMLASKHKGTASHRRYRDYWSLDGPHDAGAAVLVSGRP